MTTTYQLATLTCPSCIAKIDRAVSSVDGVENVEVLFNASKVKVDLAEGANPDVKKIIEDLGYEVLGVEG